MTDYGFGGQSWLLGRSAENSIESNLRWGLHSCGVERIDPDHIGEMRSGSDCNMSALLKIAVLSQTQNPPVRQNRQLLLMEVAMLKMPKPTIVFAILGASFAALVTSSAPSFAALSCAESLQLTGTELRVAPMGQPKSEAMGLYSAAVDAHRNRQEGQCEGDLNRVDALLDPTASGDGNVGLFTSSATPSSHSHGHGHGHGHDRH
ncbi:MULTISPECIES: hypothetical protein [unclassified Rhizobium]|uniref:hypothetical protein n=1 Tax=unclassified Rhizobium TaxID=2613769 RepID=UPI001FDEF56F|nr:MULTISPECIES: hypothetical protein [unclassified Rhizobium]